MDILAVVRVFNTLKRKRAIRDYAIFGAVAATRYMEPMYTEDMDILVLADTDEEYAAIYWTVRPIAERVQDFTFVISGTQVQVMPTTLGALYRDALLTAQTVRIGTLRTKIVDREHLILMALRAYRPKDRVRILSVLPGADKVYLRELLAKFDDERGTLAQRLGVLQGSS